jgi:peptide/nickel transport system ATP-binding protein
VSLLVTSAVPAPAAAPRAREPLLEVNDLRTYFYTEEGEIRAVDGASFSLQRGGTLAVVGESGCGKSVSAYSILRLINKPGKIVGGSIRLYPEGEAPLDLLALPDDSPELFRVRGGLAAMIFQEPLSALSPVHTIGNQICEAILLHQHVSQKEATRLATEMLNKVGIPQPEARLKQYPHELSGGMRQRVVIAMALVCNPMLLIADEPTTALDVTLQAQILRLLKELQAKLGTAILLITHDLAVVAQTADEVVVMYCGRVVERAPVRAIMKQPRHPYTQGLLMSLPNIHRRGAGQQRRLPSIAGSVPALTDLPPGCPFHPRCPHAVAGRCDTGSPPVLRALGPEHDVACVRAEELAVTELEADAATVVKEEQGRAP